MSPQCRPYDTVIWDNSDLKNQSSLKLHVPIKHHLGTEIQTESTNWKLKKTNCEKKQVKTSFESLFLFWISKKNK